MLAVEILCLVGSKQFVRSSMGKKQKAEVEKVLRGEVKEYEK